MKNKGLIIFFISLLSFISLLLIIVMILLINGNTRIFNFKFESNLSKNLIIDENYNIEFNKVLIDSDSSYINILESDDDSFRVIAYGEDDSVSVKNDSNELRITSKGNVCKSIFCVNFSIAKIEVYIPSGYSNIIKIDNRYGDTEVGGFSLADVRIKGDCGDINILSANKVDVDNSFGNILINSANIVKADAKCGNIEIEKVLKLDANNNYGDIEVKQVLDNFVITNDCGDVEIKSAILKNDSSITSSLGSIDIDEINKVYIDAKTDLGDVDIANNYNKSDITLKIRNSSGDITVN